MLFTSQRLRFRNWTDADILPFSAMNQDPEVMEYFPSTYGKEKTTQLIRRLQNTYEQHGYTFFAVDLLATNEFIGFIGIIPTSIEAHFTPCVEIGWRLKKAAWGKGYATEGAKRCLQFCFEKLNLTKVFSYTPVLNTRSERVMQKINMHPAGIFDHPQVADKHPLKPHQLYLITNDE